MKYPSSSLLIGIILFCLSGHAAQSDLCELQCNDKLQDCIKNKCPYSLGVDKASCIEKECGEYSAYEYKDCIDKCRPSRKAPSGPATGPAPGTSTSPTS